MTDKEDVRPIFNELKGYLSAAPDKNSDLLFEEPLWTQYNGTIDELNSITEEDWSKFKVNPRTIDWNGNYRTCIDTIDYRSKLSGLISRIEGRYLFGETTPASPQTIIHQTQTQTQEQQQSIVVDFALHIAEVKAQYEKGTPERTFLEELGEALKTTKSITEMLGTIFTLASKAGVALDFLTKIFVR